MHRKQTTLTLCLLLILTLLLAGCSRSESPAAQSDSPVSAESGPESIRIGGQEFSLEATEITAVLAPGETELLDRLPRLHYADLSGSEAIDEIAAWASAHPNVSVRYTIPLPNGALLPSDTVSYDLSDATAAEALSVAPALARLPGLHSVNLGVGRASASCGRSCRRRCFSTVSPSTAPSATSPPPPSTSTAFRSTTTMRAKQSTRS